MWKRIVTIALPIGMALATASLGFAQLGDKPPSFQFFIVALLAWVTVVLVASFLPLPTAESTSLVGVDRTSRRHRVPGSLILYALVIACLSAVTGWFLLMTLCYHHVRVSRGESHGSRAMTLTAPHMPVNLELQLSVPPASAIEQFIIQPSQVIAGVKNKRSSDVTVILTDFHAPGSLSLTYRVSEPTLDVALLPTARPAGIRVFEENETRRYRRLFWLQGGALWLVGLLILFVRWRQARG